MTRFGRRLLATVLALSAGAVALAGCGGAAAYDRTIELTVRFSEYSPAEFDVEPGTTVRFVVDNLDPIAHELIIGDDGVHERHEKGTEPWHPPRPGELSVAAGDRAETTFTFAGEGEGASEVVFGCHLPGHWDYGMRGVATVVVA